MMDNRTLKRWLVLGGLLCLTLYLVWNSPRSDSETAGLAQSRRAAPTAEGHAKSGQLAAADEGFRFVARAPAAVEMVDLFAPAVVKRPQQELSRVAKEMAPAPQAPPLPFTFVGRISEGGEVKVFLQANDVLYNVKVGDTFAQQYKLMGADGGKLSLLYLPLNITQTMPYGGAP